MWQNGLFDNQCFNFSRTSKFNIKKTHLRLMRQNHQPRLTSFSYFIIALTNSWSAVLSSNILFVLDSTTFLNWSISPGDNFKVLGGLIILTMVESAGIVSHVFFLLMKLIQVHQRTGDLLLVGKIMGFLNGS